MNFSTRYRVASIRTPFSRSNIFRAKIHTHKSVIRPYFIYTFADFWYLNYLMNRRLRNAALFGIFVLAAALVWTAMASAEPPAKRKVLGAVNAPDSGGSGEVGDTYFEYRDFRIPIRYYNDREVPGYVKVIDHANVLWVAKISDLDRLLDKLLPKELERVLGLADELFDSQRFERAVVEYRRVLPLLPKNAYIHLRIGQCEAVISAVEAKKARESELLRLSIDKKLQERLKTLAPTERESLQKQIAEAKQEQADHENRRSTSAEEAKKFLRSTLDLAPNSHQAVNELGLLAFSEGDLGRALELFNRAYGMSKSEVYKHNITEVRLAMSDQSLAQDRYTDAINQVETVMGMLPDYENKDLPEREESLFRRHLDLQYAQHTIPNLPKRDDEQLWVASGKRLIKGRLWREAITLFRTLLELAPAESGEAKTYKGYLVSCFLNYGDELFVEEKYDEAVAVYQEARVYIPTEQLMNQAMLKHFLRKGQQAYDDEKWTAAIDSLDRLYKIFHADSNPDVAKVNDLLASAHYFRGKAYVEVYRYQEALEDGYQAYNIERDQNEIFVREARAELQRATQSGTWMARAKAYGKLIRANVVHTFDLMPYAKLRRYAQFVSRTHVALGSLQADTHEWKEALGNFEKAYSIDPTNISAYKLYLQTLIRRFFLQQFWIALSMTAAIAAILAGAAFSIAHLRRKRKLETLHAQADKAYAAGQWAEALQLYEQYRIIARSVRTIDVYERMARCFVEIGEFNNAILNYNRAEELLGGEKRFLLEKCKIFAQRGSAEVVVQTLRESANLADTSQVLLEFLQEVMQKERDERQKFRLREVRGAVHMVRGERSTARGIFEDLHRENPRALYPLRKLIELAKSDRDQRALKDFLERYLSIDQTNAAVIFELGEYYEGNGKRREALDRYCEAYELTPIERIRQRIRVLAKSFSDQFATPEADTLGMGVASLETLRDIVNTLMKIEDFQMALEILQQLTKSGVSDPWLVRQMADCFFELSVDDMAIKYYRRFLEQHRREAETITMDETEKEALYNLARTYERKGMTELALKEYQVIYEQDIKFKDIALKIPVLYEKKTQAEKQTAERQKLSPKIMRPQEGQIRCPRCLSIVASNVANCPSCGLKLGGEAGASGEPEDRSIPLLPYSSDPNAEGE